MNIEELFNQKKRSSQSLVSIVLPVYNEEECLPLVVPELYSYLETNHRDYQFEVTFIDDCSKDSTFETLKSLSKTSPENVRLSVVRLARNCGSHVATTAGLNLARGQFAIVMASDGQDPNFVIGKFLDEWKDGNDLILAARESNLDKGVIQNFLSRITWSFLEWSTRIYVPRKGVDMLGMDRKVLDAFNRMDERNTTYVFRLLSLGFSIKEIGYTKKERVAGKSKWNFMKKLSIMADAITGFSNRPLRLILRMGLLIFVLLMIRWAVVVAKIWIFNQEPDELTIILNSLFTVFAVQILIIGAIGEYIWRILDETRKRPAYDISDVEGALFEENEI